MKARCCGNFIQVMQFRQSILWTDSGGFCVAMLPLSTPSLHLLHHWSSISEQNPTNLSPTSLFSRPALELKSNKDQIIRTVTQESGLVWTQFGWIIQAWNDCKTSWKTHRIEAKEKKDWPSDKNTPLHRQKKSAKQMFYRSPQVTTFVKHCQSQHFQNPKMEKLSVAFSIK